MNPFREIFSRLRRKAEIDEAVAALKEGLAHSLKPQGTIKSVASGVRLRDRVLSLIEKVEAETREQAVILAADGVLTNPKLHAEIQKHSDGAVLEPIVPICFPMPEAPLYFNPMWPSKIVRFHGRENTDRLLFDKASFLATFVTYNLGAGIDAYILLEQRAPEATDEEQLIVRLEEAACWYRVIDELAYLFIRAKRQLFIDLFGDFLVERLALQGTPPDLICQTMADRSEEYGQYRKWVTSDVNTMAGTLLWNAAKHIGEPLGMGRNCLFVTVFGNIFLTRVKEALVYELLTGSARETRTR